MGVGPLPYKQGLLDLYWPYYFPKQHRENGGNEWNGWGQNGEVIINFNFFKKRRKVIGEILWLVGMVLG